MEIEFQGQYDKASIFKAVSLANKPSRRKSIFRIGFSILLLAIFTTYFISLAIKETLSTYEILWSGRHLISLFFIAFFLFQPYISSYLMASKLWKNPVMQKPLVGVISSQGVTYILSNYSRRELAWESFAKKRITENLLVLLTADGTLSFFPRIFFQSAEDWNRVKQLIEFKVIEAV